MDYRQKFFNDLENGRITKEGYTFTELSKLYNYPKENGENLCKKDYYKFLRSLEPAKTFKTKSEVSIESDYVKKYTLSSFSLNKDGKTSVQWYKQNSSIESIDYKELYKEALKELSFKSASLNTYITTDRSKLLVINATDVHLNKKYFKEPVSLEEQIKTFQKAIQHIVREALDLSHIERILFIVGHDYLHSEFNNMTTKGTPQDTLESFEVLFKEAFRNIIYCIDYCNKYAPVDLVFVNGNHAYAAELQLFSALEVYYELNSNNVTLIGGKEDRKYYSYYNNSFMLLHDTRNKTADLPLLFGIESPEHFTKKNKYILSGHLHSKKEVSFLTSSEKFGIEHIQCPSLSGTDKWHHDNMYIGNKERMLGLLIDREFGIVNHIIFNK
jgi:hypothetical protein